ncbi:MAG: hypothetical protein WGN25_03995 [Candidatus Electrothrix sp. GW3-4]|uniref:hypothetical protein n=1 Tax=Candidatus Electrothrix sp. GW3-4 TaxID=3126740 RepID=UPI0030D504B8
MKKTYLVGMILCYFFVTPSFVFAGECAGWNLSCRDISNYDQCIKQSGCTYVSSSSGVVDGCYGTANKCSDIKNQTVCEGHLHCRWYEDEKIVGNSELKDSLELLSIAMKIPKPSNSSEKIKISTKDKKEKVITMKDIAAAKLILKEHGIKFSNGRCCKKDAGPNGSDACYNWDDKFCSRTTGLCSAASDECPNE